MRAKFKAQAEQLFAEGLTSYKPVADHYTRIATEYGVRPENVVLDLGYKADPGAGDASPPPAPPNATHYSRSTGKFYDAQGKEIP
jgi:hypothetical protein